MPPPELPQVPEMPRLPEPPPSPVPATVPLPEGAFAGPVVPTGPRCSVCGRTPAVAASFNAHTGMVFMWRRSVASGLFCRHCGIGVFRKQMNHTLAFGWFGLIAFFANFYAVVKNLAGRATVRRLAPPADPRPQAEGRPLFARYGVYVGLVVIGAVGTGAFVAATTSEAEELQGECIEILGDELKEVSCSKEHDARVVAVLEADSTDQCPIGTDDVFVLEDDESHVMCVDADR